MKKLDGRLCGLICGFFLATSSFAQIDPTVMPLVYQEPGMAKVLIRNGIGFKTINDTTLTLDAYYPRGADKKKLLPVVIFHNGVGGLDIPKWRVYGDWARLVASHGMIAINHQSRAGHTLEDAEALVDYLRSHAADLGIDPDRLGVWSCSGNVNTAMSLANQPSRRYIRTLVAYYGMGAPLASFRQDLEIQVVKSGLDYYFLNKGIETFMATAVANDLHVEYMAYPEGQHAFDIFDATPRSREIILGTVAFLKEKLSSDHVQPPSEVLTTSTLWQLIVDQDKVDEGLERWNAAVKMYWDKPNQSPYYNQLINERTLNLIGYQLMNSNRASGAVKLFEANQKLFPESGNVYDALADAFEKIGDRDKALKFSKLAIEKINVQPNIPPAYREAVRKSAQEKVTRLEN